MSQKPFSEFCYKVSCVCQGAICVNHICSLASSLQHFYFITNVFLFIALLFNNKYVFSYRNVAIFRSLSPSNNVYYGRYCRWITFQKVEYSFGFYAITYTVLSMSNKEIGECLSSPFTVVFKGNSSASNLSFKITGYLFA